MNITQKIGAKVVAGAALVPLFVGNAFAALPVEVETAIEAYKTDALSAVGMVMGAGVAIWGLMKLASKLGWR